MKARVKATGEIVEVSTNRIYYTTKTPNRYEHYSCTEIEILEDPDYWDKLLHQYAGMAMQGILSNPKVDLDYKSDECMPQALAATAYNIAHALVEKLKEKEERK